MDSTQNKTADLTPFDPKTMGGSIRRNIVNPDLIEERAKASFDAIEFREFLILPEQRDEFELFHSLVDRHPQLKSGIEYYDMSRDEKLKVWWERFRTIMQDDDFRYLITQNSEKKSKHMHWYYMFPGSNPMMLHMTMFTKSIMQLGSEEQVRHYLPQVNSWRIIGCYAQTELGHGSNVAGLETTATYDETTETFVIHTPTFKASKFWPGNLGVQANHAVVFARCLALESDYGVQPFIVPIRDMETHEPLPGVEVGDLGTKVGFNTTDNGYLRFNQMRVPRQAMLTRFASISKEGDFEMNADPRIIYQIMVTTRLTIIFGSSMNLLRATTAATRYAACRRQFQTVKGSDEERKLLDYQLHMNTLGYNFANGLTLYIIAGAIYDLEQKSQAEVREGNFGLLDVLHHFTSGIKAIGADMCYWGMDELRQACGGAGFLLSSGLADWWGDAAPFPTFEGVNVVMLQQSSRMLLKQFTRVTQGKKVNPFFSYLAESESLLRSKSTAKSVDHFMSLEHLEQALAVRSAACVKEVHEMLASSKASSKAKQNDLFAIDVNRMAKFHMIYLLFKLARERLASHEFKCAGIRPVMDNVLAVFALKQLSLDTEHLYETGFFGAGSGKLLQNAYKKALVIMRPQMVPLVETMPEVGVPTSIGNSHGDIYEQQYETAKSSKLNQNNFTSDFFFTHMKPAIQSSNLKRCANPKL